MTAKWKMAIECVRIRNVAPNQIEVTYDLSSPVQPSETVGRDQWISRLQCMSNMLFDRLGDRAECIEQFEIKRPILEGEHPIVGETDINE